MHSGPMWPQQESSSCEARNGQNLFSPNKKTTPLEINDVVYMIIYVCICSTGPIDFWGQVSGLDTNHGL
jgi:hypothetical protein